MLKSMPRLFDIYLQSVGRNSQLLLNLPPDRRGLIPERDAARVRQLREYLDRAFADDLARGAAVTASATRGNDPAFDPAKAVDGDPKSYWMTDDGVEAATLELRLRGDRTFNLAVLQENIEQGQRIEEFDLAAGDGDEWRTFARATTVGYKRILRFPAVTADRVRVRIVRSRVGPTLAAVSLYQAPNP
jgi:alpha-L-fucosidase